MLSQDYTIIMYYSIGAPGHGREFVNGINTTENIYSSNNFNCAVSGNKCI